MKNKLLIVILFICLYFANCDVYAAGKDVQAVFKQSYNVDLVTDTINDGQISLNMDDLSIEITSSEKNIKVILIKATNEANDYAKTFTSNQNNYYLAFYKDDEKVEPNVDIIIKTADKVLNVYSNSGKLIEKSNEKISLTGNDYFLVMTDYINSNNENYKIVNINDILDNIEDIEINETTTVEVYNSRDVKIDNTEKLGTNYKVIVTKNGQRTVYTIVTRGDTTGDARITLPDVTRLYHHYKGIENMPEAFTLAGDVATNNIINLNDITKIYHYYKGIITEL